MKIGLESLFYILTIFGKQDTGTEEANLKALQNNKSNMLVDSLLGDIKNISNSIEKLRLSSTDN
jgi:hypothetical protein